MNRKLSYNGKTLQEMTTRELQDQYNANTKRLKLRAVFFAVVTIVICIEHPLLAIVPLGIGVATTYWLAENNGAIKREIDRR